MPYTLSATTLALMKDCPRCFWLQFNKGVMRPAAIFPSLPSGMDRVLKTYFDSFRGRGLPPELMEHDIDAFLFADRKKLDEWRNYKQGLKYADVEGNVLKGMVDDVLEREGKLIVLDFKTRGWPTKEDSHTYYQNQLNIYNFLLRKAGNATEDYAFLLFYSPEKVNSNGDIHFKTELKKVKTNADEGGRLFDEAIRLLKSEMPEAKPECGFCKNKV
ncbi:MAG: PD-(D/E)XK nuclease family protein [Candidatus Woesearchaeota archaeon]